MALASTLSATVEGLSAHIVTVEANVGPGLPGMHIVGLGDAAVKESRERIRTAIANTQMPWPRTKIMVSLSPAHLRKAGSHFDLPIALCVVGASDPRVARRLERTMVMGELALDGSLRRVEGILPMLLRAQREPEGIDAVIVPRANEDEAALVGDARVLVADSLPQIWHFLIDEAPLSHPTASRDVGVGGAAGSAPDFADIAGQAHERSALEVAAAGGHHLMMVGPPGSGKSMLAERLPTILPGLSLNEQIETTALHSAAGVSRGSIVQQRPFIAPHPSLTRTELIGGGSGVPLPGAVSQAHNGVLFLDEASEINAHVLDSLRIPMETAKVSIRRGKREVVYPADFQLVMAANPCQCGKEIGKCSCPPMARARHLSNVSGPLRDRIDIFITTAAQSALVTPEGAESSAVIAARVAEARERAAFRWTRAGLPATVNGRVSSTVLRRDFLPDEGAMATLESKLQYGELTQRGVDRVLKLAWTLADLEGKPLPDLDHIHRAIDLRVGEYAEVAA